MNKKDGEWEWRAFVPTSGSSRGTPKTLISRSVEPSHRCDDYILPLLKNIMHLHSIGLKDRGGSTGYLELKCRHSVDADSGAELWSKTKHGGGGGAGGAGGDGGGPYGNAFRSIAAFLEKNSHKLDQPEAG